MTFPISKIVSGGQTGADRGGLDAALALGIPAGGWCPKGRLAEDGVVPNRYPVCELRSRSYVKRTERNVVDSTATVILTLGKPTGGSLKAAKLAEKHGRPCLCLDLKAMSDENAAAALIVWCRKLDPGLVLNVAGSRESKAPGLQERVARILTSALAELNGLARPIEVVPEPEETMIELPFVGNLAAGWPFDGFTVASLAEAEEFVPVPTSLAGAGRYVVEVAGDSMRPTLLPGELVVCEYHRTPRQQGQVVVMASFTGDSPKGECALKRFHDSPDNWMFKSDNPAHEDIPVLKADQPQYPILGVAIYNLTRKVRINGVSGRIAEDRAEYGTRPAKRRPPATRSRISRDEALRIAIAACQPDASQFTISDTPPAKLCLYGGEPEPCWYIHAPWGDEQEFPGLLRSSRIIIISKATGKVLYNGSAHDEG